ncbi:MAG: DNA-processing protein DprA [Chloroflexota bacterium]
MGDQRRYWVGFNRVTGIGAVRLRALLDAFGDLEAAWHAPLIDLQAVGLDQRCVQGILEARETMDLDEDVRKIEASGYRLVTWEDADYPSRLLEIDAPPPVLYVWGALEPQDRLAVSVVGTRRPTAYGMAAARDLAGLLASSGVTVVSGLARGIDAVAHRAALEAGGRTLAVLGSGLDRLYPPEHRRLAEAVAGSGAVLTDYPLGTAPEAGNFPPRNRLIAGLSLAVVIVEAGEGSGALITADFAAEQGREVFAVPGSIYSRASRGTNELLRAGARPLVSPEDVLEALNLDAIVRQEAASQALPEDRTEAQVLEALSAEPVHVDELTARIGLSPSQISASLAMLELKGRARQVGGMHYVRVREPGPEYRVE